MIENAVKRLDQKAVEYFFHRMSVCNSRKTNKSELDARLKANVNFSSGNGKLESFFFSLHSTKTIDVNMFISPAAIC